MTDPEQVDADSAHASDETKLAEPTVTIVELGEAGAAMLRTLQGEASSDERVQMLVYLRSVSHEVGIQVAQHGIADIIINWIGHNGSLDEAVAETVAELAKEEDARKYLTSLIAPIAGIVKSGTCAAAQYQAMRALGNLCFECPTNRAVLVTENLASVIVDYAKSAATLPHRRVSAGVILNTGSSTQALQQIYYEMGAIDTLSQFLLDAAEEEDDSLLSMVLAAFNELADHRECRQRIANAEVIAHLLTSLEAYEPEIEEESKEDKSIGGKIVALLKSLIDDDAVKPLLAPFVVRLLEMTSDAGVDLDYRQKLATLVGVLISDEQCLGNVDKSKLIFDYALPWCETDGYETAGCLCLGNIARSDEAVMEIFKLAPQTLSVLRKLGENQSSLIQHAAWGTIKNFAICQPLRPVLFEMGLLDHVLPLLESMHESIRYSAIAVVRLLCTLQAAAEYVAKKEELITAVIGAAKSVEHKGLSAESARAVANIIRFCGSSAGMTFIEQNGGVLGLLTLLTSDHELMQNEGLIALIILAGNGNEASCLNICSAGVIPALIKMFERGNTSHGILANASTLLQLITEHPQCLAAHAAELQEATRLMNAFKSGASTSSQ